MGAPFTTPRFFSEISVTLSQLFFYVKGLTFWTYLILSTLNFCDFKFLWFDSLSDSKLTLIIKFIFIQINLEFKIEMNKKHGLIFLKNQFNIFF